MKLQKYLEFKKNDLEAVKSFRIQDELNPKVWQKGEIDVEVKENLLQIGQDFYDSTDLEADVIDIILCGSLSNYNWSEKYSDYDLHIIINYKDIDENLILVEKLCDLSKKQWNSAHEIKVKGYDVEVAIQDENDLRAAIKGGRMGGVYSLMEDKWIKKPEKVEFEPDEKLISEKGKTIMMEVDDIEEMVDELPYEEVKERIKKVWEKIKTLRERALEEEGEFGIGNLLFKLLRRSNYIGKIMKMKQKAYDKQFEEFTDDVLIRFLYELETIEKGLSGDESWSQYLSWYDLNEDECKMKIEFGQSGYSEGWSENWELNWSDPEWVSVKSNHSHSGPYGSGEEDKEMKFDSFKELLEELKSNFGL